MRAVAGSDWGFDKQLLRTTYLALVRSVMETAAPAWAPWVSDTNFDFLQRVQYEGGRIITGAIASTPTDMILEEAGMAPLDGRTKAISIIAMEKSRRLETDNPRRKLAEDTAPHRLQRKEWRRDAEEERIQLLGNKDEQWGFPQPKPPWRQRIRVDIDTKGTKTADAGRNKEMALKKLRNNNQYDWIIYTDGSAQGGRDNGGAGIVVTTGGGEEPRVIETIKLPAGERCSSYQAEMVAIEGALNWLTEKGGTWSAARIATDSKASIESLRHDKPSSRNYLVSKINNKLVEMRDRDRTINLTWIPSHCGVAGNEWADEVANEGSNMNQDETGWLFEVDRARIKNSFEKRQMTHERAIAIYGKGGVREDKENFSSKAEAKSFRRFRMGHSLELNAYCHRIGRPETEWCRLCGEKPETTEHVLLDCPRLQVLRRKLGIEHLSDMCTKPQAALSLWNSFKDLAIARS